MDAVKVYTEFNYWLAVTKYYDAKDQCTVLQVFHELLRYLSHAPIGLPHLAVEDTNIDQYLIPKNIQVCLRPTNNAS